jgi:UPF0755 protein
MKKKNNSKKQQNIYKKYFSKILNLKLSDIALFIREHRTQLFNYFYQLILPLTVFWVIYALIFYGCTNNFNYKEVQIKVGKKSTANSILYLLNRNYLIRNRRSVKAAILLTSWDKKLRAGKYTLNQSMSTKQIFEILMGKRGLSDDENVRIVVPEGYSLLEIMEELDSKKVIDKKEMEKFIADLERGSWKQKYDFLANNNLDNKHFFEGYLFPDTYSFAEDSYPEIILDAML